MNLFQVILRKFRSRREKTPKRASSPRNNLIRRLERDLKYSFKNLELLEHGLTHKSKSGQNDHKGLLSNERLEFLGDAVLNCLVTEHLYNRFPTYSEGQLSKIKSLVVSRKILGDIGLSIDLGKYLILGSSEKKTGGQRRKSIISNAFEGVIGAVYLDGGFDAVRNCLEHLLFCRIDEFLEDKSNINYKSKILEMSQKDGFGIPNYILVSTSGPEHAKKFVTKIEIAGVELGTGSGSNKKIAQQNAASEAIKNYNKEDIQVNAKGVQVNELLPN